MRGVLILSFLMLGLVFLSGCVQQQPPTGQGGNGSVNGTAPANNGTGNEGSSTVFHAGSFSLQVVKCLDDKLVIRNNGTGTVLLNSSTLVQSRGGIVTYGTVAFDYVLQPEDVRTIQLTRNISRSGLYRFRLNTVMKTSTGNNYVITNFECSE